MAFGGENTEKQPTVSLSAGLVTAIEMYGFSVCNYCQERAEMVTWLGNREPLEAAWAKERW